MTKKKKIQHNYAEHFCFICSVLTDSIYNGCDFGWLSASPMVVYKSAPSECQVLLFSCAIIRNNYKNAVYPGIITRKYAEPLYEEMHKTLLNNVNLKNFINRETCSKLKRLTITKINTLQINYIFNGILSQYIIKTF